MSLCNSSEVTMYPERQLKYHQSLIQSRKINDYLKKKKVGLSLKEIALKISIYPNSQIYKLRINLLENTLKTSL